MAFVLSQVLWALCLSLTPTIASQISSKREVLTDLSNGFCRSHKFGVCIANDKLYMTNLDGGIIPGDGNSTNNYLVTFDLTSSFSVDEGSSYRMELMDASVPKIKDAALWADQTNRTLFVYGGRYPDKKTLVDGRTWTYGIPQKSWRVQQNSIQPTRLISGAYTDARRIQAAYWVGGYEESSTTPVITDDSKLYATGMIQLNTTTAEYTSLDAPFTPVQEGALAYLPVGQMGVLVFIGGDVPSARDGVNTTLSPNSWNYVQVYDIAAGKWHKQSTSGTVPARTQFCAVVQHAESSPSYEIWVLGGADLQSRSALSDVSYLSIPSFKWYRASPLHQQRMTLACAAYGRQIFGVGGRRAWAIDGRAGCYHMPAFLYDAQAEAIKSEFDPTLSSYALPDSTANDIRKSPYPSVWADAALKDLFVLPTSNTSSNTSATPSQPGRGGVIAGAVVGALVFVTALLIIVYLVIRRRRQNRQRTARTEHGYLNLPLNLKGNEGSVAELRTVEASRELAAEPMPRRELHASPMQRYELGG